MKIIFCVHSVRMSWSEQSRVTVAVVGVLLMGFCTGF